MDANLSISIAERILAGRQTELTRQITLWRNFLRNFTAENHTRGCPSWDCVTLSYGNLIRNVEKSGLAHIFRFEGEWHGSIKDFELRTSAIQLANGARFHGYGYCQVENLNIAFRAELQKKKSVHPSLRAGR